MNVSGLPVFMRNTLRRRVITRMSSSSSAYLNTVSRVRKWPSRAPNSITEFRRYAIQSLFNRRISMQFVSSLNNVPYKTLWIVFFLQYYCFIDGLYIYQRGFFFFFYESLSKRNDTIDVCKIKIGTSLEGEDASLANNCWPAIREFNAQFNKLYAA